MTPHENLGFARAAMSDAENAGGFSGHFLEAEKHALQRAQAHALVGILEHLIGPPKPEKLVFDEHPKMPDPIQVTVNLDGTPFKQMIVDSQNGLIGTVTDAISEADPKTPSEPNESAEKLAYSRKHGAMISLSAASAGYGDVPPPASAKFRICMGCGNAHPLTTIGGRLVDHWHPKSLGDATISPALCGQREIVYGDTEKEAREKADEKIREHNERAATIQHEYENPTVSMDGVSIKEALEEGMKSAVETFEKIKSERPDIPNVMGDVVQAVIKKHLDKILKKTETNEEGDQK